MLVVRSTRDGTSRADPLPPASPQCALAKLAYLLSKPLTTDQVKHLLSISLRGEISAPSSAAPPPPAVNDLERLNDLLVQAVDLTGGRELLDLPQRRRRRPAADGGAGTGDEADEVVDGPEEVAAWGRTENASHLLEAAILPQLLFKAVSTPQAPDTLRALLDAYSSPSSASSSGGDAAQPQPADADDPACANVVNALNSVGMGLLHVACVHGSAACVRVLLERGASVHVRDMLGCVGRPPFFCRLLLSALVRRPDPAPPPHRWQTATRPSTTACASSTPRSSTSSAPPAAGSPAPTSTAGTSVGSTLSRARTRARRRLDKTAERPRAGRARTAPLLLCEMR